MKKNHTPNTGQAASLELNAIDAFNKAGNPEAVLQEIKDTLYDYLKSAAELEHMLSMQYLFTAFSLKKYPEEFSDYDPQKPADDPTNLMRLRQIEVIRKWDAKILYVSRQEMEHLNLVQNLMAILGYDPYMFRPNFPVLPVQNPMGEPINLMPFSKKAIEVFRYWEKPDELPLDNPFESGFPAGILALRVAQDQSGFDLDQSILDAWTHLIGIIEGTEKDAVKGLSIETLYTYVDVYFYFLLSNKLIQGQNIDRIVEEHFGFNITLDPIVEGKYYEYINQVIGQILEEGEGVWGVPPPLDSHFMVYQTILEELQEEVSHSNAAFEASLPVVMNPITASENSFHNVDLSTISDLNSEDAPLFMVDNEVTVQAMELFNKSYEVLNRMLFGFFATYNIDYTTGIRKSDTNAFFRTSFYPFMTMVIRPLGEMVCRLPALSSFQPNGGRVPDKTAGPNFFYNIPQNASLEEIQGFFTSNQSKEDYLAAFKKIADDAEKLAIQCRDKGYHMANYQAKDARDFDVRLTYLSENLTRIGQNFNCYWDGKITAPIPSKNFQNFNDAYN